MKKNTKHLEGTPLLIEKNDLWKQGVGEWEKK